MPSCNLPDPAQVQKAIDIYLSHAYPSSQPPLAARSMINLLKTWGGDYFAAPAFARTGEKSCPRLTVRLGNTHYPHMKMALEPAPNGESYLFKADSHDKHLCPAENSPDYAAFMDLRAKNQQVVEKIEQAWAEAGIPTFKTFLQADLSRRQGNA